GAVAAVARLALAEVPAPGRAREVQVVERDDDPVTLLELCDSPGREPRVVQVDDVGVEARRRLDPVVAEARRDVVAARPLVLDQRPEVDLDASAGLERA